MQIKSVTRCVNYSAFTLFSAIYDSSRNAVLNTAKIRRYTDKQYCNLEVRRPAIPLVPACTFKCRSHDVRAYDRSHAVKAVQEVHHRTRVIVRHIVVNRRIYRASHILKHIWRHAYTRICPEPIQRSVVLTKLIQSHDCPFPTRERWTLCALWTIRTVCKVCA